jgi:hypothetical protein
MDHEVEDHVDLGAALLETGEALGVDVQRAVHAFGERFEGVAVALHVPHLQHGVFLRRQIDQVVGLGQRRGERLFHQYVHAFFKARARHFVMQVGRHGDHRRLDVAEDLPEIRNFRPRRIAIHHRGNLDARQAREFLGVKATHVAGTDNGEFQ